MGGAIIRDQIQFLVRVGGQQSAQETDEGGTVVAPDGFGSYLSAMDLQGGQQRGGSGPLLFVTKTFEAGRVQREARVSSLQGLDGGFLLHPQDHPILGRGPVGAS